MVVLYMGMRRFSFGTNSQLKSLKNELHICTFSGSGSELLMKTPLTHHLNTLETPEFPICKRITEFWCLSAIKMPSEITIRIVNEVRAIRKSPFLFFHIMSNRFSGICKGCLEIFSFARVKKSRRSRKGTLRAFHHVGHVLTLIEGLLI